MERRVGEVRRDGGEGWWRGGGRGVHIMSLRCRSSTAATAGKAFFSRAFAQASRPPPYTPASLRPFLDRQGTVILDGGLGTALGGGGMGAKLFLSTRQAHGRSDVGAALDLK